VSEEDERRVEERGGKERSMGRERKGWNEGNGGGNREMKHIFLSFIHCMY
jgi:hypothetical protein